MTDDMDASREELTDTQLEILEMIREEPNATQKEFAEKLGVTPAAVGSRVRQIPGMNGTSRRWRVAESSARNMTSDTAPMERPMRKKRSVGKV